MTKTYKIEVDCANCANKMEAAANKASGVNNAVINFMAQKMTLDFKEGANIEHVMNDVLAKCKKVERDCEIYF